MKEQNTMVYNARGITTFRDLLEGSVELYGERTAFLYSDAGEITEVTYERTFENVRAFAAYLRSLLPEGAKVAVIGKNSYFWALTYLTVTCGVGMIVPIDKDLRSDEIEALLSTADVGAVVYSPELKEKIIGLQSDRRLLLNMEDFEEYLEKGRDLIAAGDRSYEQHRVDPHAPGILLFTSGTTGVSKGVVLSQYNICSNLMSIAKIMRIYPEDRALSIAPLHHTFECTAGFLVIFYNGGSIAYNSSLRRLQAELKLFRPTVMASVPLILNTFRNTIIKKYSQMRGGKAVLSLQRVLSDMTGKKAGKRIFSIVNETFGGRMRLIVSGAAPLEPETYRDYERFGIKVYIGYGLTETSPVVTVHTDFYSAPDDIGFPLPGTKVRLDNVNEEGVGELVVKGPGVMLGYYHDPAATEQVMEDGWFHTGDLARCTPRGTYQIAGRIKSMIVTPSGKKVFPEELELFLCKHPCVAECMVYESEEEGVSKITAAVYPDEEEVAARLSKEGVTPGSAGYEREKRRLIQEAVKGVNARFPAYKHITRLVLRSVEFEKTTTRKIRRNAPENRVGE